MIPFGFSDKVVWKHLSTVVKKWDNAPIKCYSSHVGLSNNIIMTLTLLKSKDKTGWISNNARPKNEKILIWA